METETSENLPRQRGQRLRWLRNIANLSQKAFCERYGFNVSTFKGWEAGRHGGLTQKAAAQIVAILPQENISCSISWLMHNDGAKPSIVHQLTPDSSAKEQHVLAELELFRAHAGDILFHTIDDDGMLPYYKPNTLVAGPRHHKSGLTKLVKQACIIETQTKLFCRYIEEIDDQHYATLSCLNYQSQMSSRVIKRVKIISAAPIVWQRSKIF